MERTRIWVHLALSIVVASGGLSQDAFVSLDEMEDDVAARWRDVTGAGAAALTPDEEIVKEGAQSGLWNPSAAAQQIYLDPEGMPTDWAVYGALEMWVHSAEATGAVFAVSIHSENEQTPGEDYYRCLIPVDWQGWRFLHLEPRSFSLGREPVGWRQADSLRLSIAGWSDLRHVPGTVLRFDALRLVTATRTPERRVLFEPDTDWCAWWPLTYATDPVQTGRYVAEWYVAERTGGVVNRSVPRNWSGGAYLNMWLHATHLEGTELAVNVASDSPDSEATDRYDATVDVDWSGWQLVSLPLAKFHRGGEPEGWHAVDGLSFALGGEDEFSDEARLCIDDIWLSALAGVVEAGPALPGGDLDGPLVGPIAPTLTAPGDNGSTTPAVDVDALIAEALAAKKEGDLELAFTKYIGALLREPAHVGAHWGLAWILAQRGEKEAAIEHFEAVVEMSKDAEQVAEARSAMKRLRAGE